MFSHEDHIKIEQILLKVASSSPDCALALMRMMLYQSKDNPLLSRSIGVSSIYIIYQLGISDVLSRQER